MESRITYTLAFYADVARRAAAEVDGVVGTARDPFLGLIGKISRGHNRAGVRVYEENGGVCMEVDIVAAFGHDLRDVLRRAQKNVVNRVTEMTGTAPEHVTVAVKGVAGKDLK